MEMPSICSNLHSFPLNFDGNHTEVQWNEAIPLRGNGGQQDSVVNTEVHLFSLGQESTKRPAPGVHA